MAGAPQPGDQACPSGLGILKEDANAPAVICQSISPKQAKLNQSSRQKYAIANANAPLTVMVVLMDNTGGGISMDQPRLSFHPEVRGRSGVQYCHGGAKLASADHLWVR